MIAKGKAYIDKLQHTTKTFGLERRKNLTKEILKDGTPLPKPLQYKDIDDSFKDFVANKLDIAYEGKKIPTLTLLSNQRFSEYAQSWQYVDNDKNILMNFKTITRENNPKPGENQGGLWNIPGERMYPIARIPVLDKNGTESMLIYKMKQPYCVDLVYDISLFTNKYELLNKFNQLVINEFKARQCYIRPNEHFLPMILEEISDESEYSIDDRKFFSQTFHIKVMAYIINEDDFEVEQVPKRVVIAFEGERHKKKPEVLIDEIDGEYQYKNIDITMKFPEYEETIKYEIDTNVEIETITMTNIRYFRLHVNDEPIYTSNGFSLKSGDNLKIKIKKIDITSNSTLIFKGVDKDIILSEKEINPESMLDSKEGFESIIID